ncbi:carboxypeptidase regulatory-like domain-containing protein [Silvibacterium acidisoli]|uniref:carboxypeptidase regulatory-like domain-containing protein n=1 Tax=Acidobacteriaceae bacterium ZG23-2 TaxID=2883246 RepID=UPI00406D104D
MTRRWNWIALLFAALVSATCMAQSTNSGDIRGTVTDATGAVIPDVKITVLNVDTGVSKDFTSNNDGIYDTSSIVAGSYTVTFTKEGFDQLVRGPITLDVGFTTVNAALKVGSVAEKVVVNTDVPLLKTESGEQSTTLEAKSLSQLPETGQDWENFTILIPGAAGNASFNNGPNPGQVASVNGNLPYNSVLADGASTTLPSSSNSDVSILETVAELQVSTSAFSAQYGIGGVIFNQISKSGTNSFHGAAYEYFQNDALNAKNYGFGNDVSVNFLRYNNFGGSIGGPILKKRMFFYFNFDKIDQNGGSNTGYKTVPTDAMMAGDFTAPGLPTLYDPTSQTIAHDASGNAYPVRKSFIEEYGSNKIPANMIDPVAAKIQAFYPTATNHPSTGHFVPGTVVDGIVTNNYYYNIPAPNPFTKYFGRLDWDISTNNRLTLSDTQRDNPNRGLDIYACPIDCQAQDVDSNNAQISDVWNISSQTINEARFGFTTQLNFYGSQTLGKGYPAELGLQFAKADAFPTVNINGANSCCYALGPGTNAVYKEFAFDPSDVVTMIRGRHILHFGGELLAYRDNTTAWGNINAATVNYSGVYTQNWSQSCPTCAFQPDATTGVAYGDFLLGQTQSWSAQVQPEYGARLKSPQFFVQDDIKLKPNLTLNVGLRYQIQHGWNEVKNNISVFDPEVTNPATGTAGAIWYAATHAHGRTSLQAPIYDTFLPRAGFSYSPQPNTTIRGGVGLYAYNYSLDLTGTGLGSALQSQGSDSDQTNGITPVVLLSGSGANLPYVGPTTDPAAQNGQGVNYNMYHTPLGKSLQWNFAIQRQVGNSMVAELAYVASHGYNLAFPTDLNQVPEAHLGPDDSPTFRPYPQYQGIGGSNGTINAISNYHSLQVSISKRLTQGFSINANYVWSHFLDDQDSSGWGSREGTQTWQRAYDPSANYGASNFDIRNAFKAYGLYQLPFGQGRMFLHSNRMLDAVVGGWQLSGTLLLSSGNPFTPTISSTQDKSYSQSGGNGYAYYPNQIGSPTLKGKGIDKWFNPAAYTLPANGTFGDMRRNSVYGPGLNEVNLSAGKTFALTEGMQMQIRADATNAFNHPSFGLPNSSLSCSGVGDPCTSAANVTGTTVGGRTMQLGARFSF